MTNCKNCGAPLKKKDECEYCGTINMEERRKNEKAVADLVNKGLMTINEARTVMYADDKVIEVIE